MSGRQRPRSRPSSGGPGNAIWSKLPGGCFTRHVATQYAVRRAGGHRPGTGRTSFRRNRPARPAPEGSLRARPARRANSLENDASRIRLERPVDLTSITPREGECSIVGWRTAMGALLVRPGPCCCAASRPSSGSVPERRRPLRNLRAFPGHRVPRPRATSAGRLRVPLDYGHPSGGTVPLAVIEHPAPTAKGVIVFNPGGPGESGVLILPILASFVPASVRSQFTLVSFDERGTGSSDPLLCGPSPAAAGSAVAGTPAATRTFAGLDRSCRSKYPTLFPTVDTTTSARDMNSLRMALGVDRINYYGVSYGTVLGSVYRQLFPTHVRSMVLDGAVDANLSLPTDATLEAPAIQAALEHVFLRAVRPRRAAPSDLTRPASTSDSQRSSPGLRCRRQVTETTRRSPWAT